MLMVVPVVLKLDKAVSVLDDDVADAAIALEELLDVPLANVVGNVPDVDSLAGRHLATWNTD